MKMLMILCSLLVVLYRPYDGQSAPQVAKAKMVRGQVFAVPATGDRHAISPDAWITEGDRIETADKSFIQILFTDKSTMNVGPNSKVEIKKYTQNAPGLINVISGQIRSKVTKDVRQDQEQSKLYIRTKTAAMGIRGTDFSVIYTPGQDRTSLVTYEGEVAMVQTGATERLAGLRDMENALRSDTAVRVGAGQFSGAATGQDRTSTPVKISPIQLNVLKKNDEGKQNGGAEESKAYRSPVPPGLSAKAAMSESPTLEKQVAAATGADTSKTTSSVTDKTPPPEGMKTSSGAFAPPAGGIIDLKTGVYIAPPPGSTFDANTQTYQVPPNYGQIDKNTGEYVPPAGMKLSNDGAFIADKVESAGPRGEAAAPTVLLKLPVLNNPVIISAGPSMAAPIQGPSLASAQTGNTPSTTPTTPAPCNDPCFCGIGTPATCGGQPGSLFGTEVPTNTSTSTRVNFIINVQ